MFVEVVDVAVGYAFPAFAFVASAVFVVVVAVVAVVVAAAEAAVHKVWGMNRYFVDYDMTFSFEKRSAGSLGQVGPFD